jgi:hypothetical protein
VQLTDIVLPCVQVASVNLLIKVAFVSRRQLFAFNRGSHDVCEETCSATEIGEKP